MKKLTKSLSLCFALLFMCAMLLPACGSDPTDKFIAEYEKLVVKFEEAAKKVDGISQDELNALQKESLEFANKTQDLMKDAKNVSAKQMETIQKLAQRLMTASQQIKVKPAAE